MEILELVFDRGTPKYPEFVFGEAVAGGHLHIVKWLYEEKRIADVGVGFIDAARMGHLEMLKYFSDKRPYTVADYTAIDGAATAGRLDVVQWLHFHTQTKCTKQAMDAAAERAPACNRMAPQKPHGRM
uniref:Uncharacterized protein n=1 Tax=Hyaloperonospora arabidopsidis (strain Emoy2) TaxID=559515 RepID=M4BCG0_HYAAE